MKKSSRPRPALLQRDSRRNSRSPAAGRNKRPEGKPSPPRAAFSGRGRHHKEEAMPKRKRGNPHFGRLPPGLATPPPGAMVLHRGAGRSKKKRNAFGGGGLSNMKTNKLLLAGGALAGGAATVVVAEKFGLTPVAAGGATAGAALAGSSLVKNQDIKDALFAASMGAGGLVGVQLLGQWYGRHQASAAGKPAQTPKQRMAEGDGGYVTRQELNDALAQVADKNAHAIGQLADKS